MQKPKSHRFTVFLLGVIALALFGIAVSSLSIESVTSHTVHNAEADVRLNAPYVRETVYPQEVIVSLLYHGYEDTIIRLQPLYCLEAGFELNGVHHLFPNSQSRWCDALTMDLGPWLQPGRNILKFKIHFYSDVPLPFGEFLGIGIGQPFFSAGVVRSGLSLIIIGSGLLLLWQLLARQGFNTSVCLISVLVCIFYAECLHILGPYSGTDWNGHVKYIQFISDHPFRPYDYTGWENWQPPLYYWLCAFVARSIQWSGALIDAWTGIQGISVIAYLGFLYYGMRTLDSFLKGPLLYLALLMLAFWPAATDHLTCINNDSLESPFYAASYYYTLRWYYEKNPRLLAGALVFCGIALAFKVSGIIPASVIVVAVILKALRQPGSMRDWFRPTVIMGYVVLIAGFLFSQGRYIYHSLTTQNETPFLLIKLGGYEVHFSQALSFWNDGLDSLLFSSDVAMTHTANIIALVYLAMMGYALFLILLPTDNKHRLPLFIVLSIIMPAIVLLTSVQMFGLEHSFDFRYAYPVVIATILLFFMVLNGIKHRPVIYYAGQGMALAFIVYSVVYNWQQLHA